MKLYNKGFTFFEIIVSVVLFALIIAGIASIFVAGRRYIMHSRSRIQAAEVAKYFLEQYYKDVRQDSWNATTNPLYLPPSGSITRIAGNQTLNNILFNGTYNVTNVTANREVLRRVTLQINWTEPNQ